MSNAKSDCELWQWNRRRRWFDNAVWSIMWLLGMAAFGCREQIDKRSIIHTNGVDTEQQQQKPTAYIMTKLWCRTVGWLAPRDISISIATCILRLSCSSAGEIPLLVHINCNYTRFIVVGVAAVEVNNSCPFNTRPQCIVMLWCSMRWITLKSGRWLIIFWQTQLYQPELFYL